MRKLNRGITLIALVITIIVLLILVGVTINSIMGKNGLIEKSAQAVEETKKKSYEEEVNTIIMEAQIEKQTNSEDLELIEMIKDKISQRQWHKSIKMYDERGIEVDKNGIELIEETIDGYEIKIKVEDGTAQIESIENSISPTYTITYNSNNGLESQITQECKAGKKINLKNCEFSKENYRFIGWSEKKEDYDKLYSENAQYEPQGDVTLYAIWEEITVSLSFDANGGTGTMEPIQVGVNKNTDLPINKFTKSKYSFVEWNTKKDGTGQKYADGGNININADTILYAQWKIATVIISFNSNDGTWKTENVAVTKGEMTPVPINIFKREGYEFTGWNTHPYAEGGWYFDGDQMNLTSNIELYAQWMSSSSAYYTGFEKGSPVPWTPTDEYCSGNFSLASAMTRYVIPRVQGLTIKNKQETSSGGLQFIYYGLRTYDLTSDSDANCWLALYISGGTWTSGVCFGQLKLVFKNGASYTLDDAVKNNYVDPFFVCSSASRFSEYRWSNIGNVPSGGTTESKDYSSALIMVKVKNTPVSSIQFSSNGNFDTRADGLRIWQLPKGWNFSKTKW